MRRLSPVLRMVRPLTFRVRAADLLCRCWLIPVIGDQPALPDSHSSDPGLLIPLREGLTGPTSALATHEPHA